MKRVILVAFALVALVLAAAPKPTLAGEIVEVAGGVSGTAPATAAPITDFDIEVASNGPGVMTCHGTILVGKPPNQVQVTLGASLWVNGNLQSAPTLTGDGTTKVTFQWNAAIQPGDTVTAAFLCTQNGWNSFWFKAYFTPETITDTSDPTALPSVGWVVTPYGRVSVANDQPAAIDFSDLRLQLPTTPITISSMQALVTGPSTGTPAAVPSGTVPAGTPTQPGLLLVDDPLLNKGDFLTSRAVTHFHDIAYSPLNATVVTGHQDPGNFVGGIADAPDVPLKMASASSLPYAGIAGVAAGGLLLLVVGGWYARRRWLI